MGRRTKPPPNRTERRYDKFGEFRVLAEAEGYLMVRRRGCGVSVMTVADWERMPLVESAKVVHLPQPLPPFGSGKFRLEIDETGHEGVKAKARADLAAKYGDAESPFTT